MVDETTDCSRHEQIVFCLRFCDQQFNIHELFMGLYELAQQDSTILFKAVNNVLVRFNLNESNCRGQRYNGAANVAGTINGLQAKICGRGKSCALRALCSSFIKFSCTRCCSCYTSLQ